MKRRESIRNRLITASVVLAAVIMAFFAGVVVLVTMTIKHEFIDKRLYSFAELWAGGAFNPISAKPPELEFLREGEIPPRYSSLGPGVHTVVTGTAEAHILIAIDDSGERYAVIDNRSDYLSLEFVSLLAVMTSFVAAILLAIFIGRSNASRVISPLTRLAIIVDGALENFLVSMRRTKSASLLAR